MSVGFCRQTTEITTYFALIRFWWPPLANLRSKQAQQMFIRATQNDFRRVRNLRFDVVRHWDDDSMAEAELHVDPHSAQSFALSSRICFKRGTISNADEVKRDGKAFCHAGDGVLDESAGKPPHRALFLELRIFDAES